MSSFQVDQWLHFERGAIRIDRIANGQVYYCRWRSGEEFGELLRTPIDTFAEAVEAEVAREATKP